MREERGEMGDKRRDERRVETERRDGRRVENES